MDKKDLRLMVLESAEALASNFNGDVNRVDPEDLELLLADVAEDNWAEKARELAELSYWFN